MDFLKALVGASTLIISSYSAAEVFPQKMEGPNGELVRGSAHYNALSSSGRYLMWTSLNSSSRSEFYIRDLKRGTTEAIEDNFDNVNSTCFAISANGRYAAYNYLDFEGGTRVGGGIYLYDRVETTHTQVTGFNSFNCDNNVKVSSKGDVAYYPSLGELFFFDASENTHTQIGSNLEVANFSYDGNKLLYIDHNNLDRVFIYDTTTDTSSLVSNASVNKATISGNGKTVIFSSEDTRTIYAQELSSGSTRSFDLGSQHFFDTSNLSASLTGEFVSFKGTINETHPDFDPNRLWTSRMFRLNTLNAELTNYSTTIDDGGPIGFYNNTNFISADGSMISYCSSAKNILNTELISAEEPYHAYSNNGYARNYLFVEMPNGDIGFDMYQPMHLVADHTWEGLLDVDSHNHGYFYFDAGGNWLANGTYQTAEDWEIHFGDNGLDGQANRNENPIVITEGEGRYRVTFNDETLAYTIEKIEETNYQRTVVFIYGQTQPGQDMFIRGGIDHAWANNNGRNCTSTNYECSIPIISHNNMLNSTTAGWKVGDNFLDWYGSESTQSNASLGTPLDWTTDSWPSSWGPKRTVAVNGSGETPLNTYGHHFWMLDVDLDCSRTENGWFELKSFISNGPGWEADVNQAGTPYSSRNHFAQCGRKNVFFRNWVDVKGYGWRGPNDYIVEDL